MTSGVCQQQSCFHQQKNANKDLLQDFTESDLSHLRLFSSTKLTASVAYFDATVHILKLSSYVKCEKEPLGETRTMEIYKILNLKHPS